MDEWISIKKELPPPFKDVLANLQEGKYWSCQPLYGEGYYTKKGISHWCKLPKRLESNGS